MASECSRAVLSCSRCRRRKIKCDRQMPSCSQCTAAKTTCTGFSASATSMEIPRSIVRHLEFEIAQLETELAKGGHLDTFHGADILHGLQTPLNDSHEIRPVQHAVKPVSILSQTPQDPLMLSIMTSRELTMMISATFPNGCGLTDLLSRVRMGLTPSPTTTVAQVNGLQRASVSPKAMSTPNAISTAVLSSMPTKIIEDLIKKYVSKVLPQYPFLDEAAIWGHLDVVKKTLGPSSNNRQSVAPIIDFLIVYLLLAISITLGSAKGGHEARCMAFSASLFEEGIRHLTSHMHVPSDIASLQVNLLILLYASINPRSANVWILSGAALRSCLDVGLHRDYPDSLLENRDVVDLRRRVFWSAYCMDRSICSALQRPVSIPDAAINTKFPYLNLNPSSPSSPFMSLVYYHQLVSEMLQVHFQGQSLPNGISWEDWLSEMEQKLRKWYESTRHEAGNDEIGDFALARGLTILHRPSPRMPVPSDRSLLIAFEAAASSARSHRDHIRSGFFRRPWLSAQHTLEAAVVVLFCLRHGRAHISDQFNSAQIFEMTKLFTSNFLAIAAQGWPEVSRYAGVYERLLGPLLESIFSANTSSLLNFGPAQEAELTALLYPGPAQLDKLRFGRRQDEVFEPFDFATFNFENDLLDFDAGPSNLGSSTDFLGAFDLLEHVMGMEDIALGF